MNKGKLGINLHFYAVIAFIFAIFGWTTALCLLTGFVVLAEKDEWTSRQTLQALLLSVFADVVNIVDSYLGISRIYISNWDGSEVIELINNMANGVGTFFDVISTLFGWVCLVFAIIAIMNVAKGKDAKIPGISSMVNWGFGIVAPKPVYQQPVNHAQFNGQQNMNYQQPNNMQFNGQQNMNYQQPTNQAPQFNGQAPVQNQQMEQPTQPQNNNIQ